jgi:FkbM family methyltransferase
MLNVIRQTYVKLIQFFIKVLSFLIGFGNANFFSHIQNRLLVKKFGNYECALVFDIGANDGKWTASILRHFPNATFLLFEPNPDSCKILNKRFANEESIQIYNIGFSDVVGENKFFIHKNSQLSSTFKRSIFKPLEFKMIISKFETVESFVSKKKIIPNIVKIDAEGSDFKILLGCGNLLSKIDLIQFEFGGTSIDAKTNFAEHYNLLSKHGFIVYRISFLGLIEIQTPSVFEEIMFPSNYLAINNKR